MNSTVYAVDEYGNEAENICSGYVGEIKMFGFAGVPAHCLACDGSEISRATYNELFKVFGETYGAGDGETTFNLPDFRGAFLRCVGGNAATLGVEQGDAIRNLTGHVSALYNREGTATIGGVLGWANVADNIRQALDINTPPGYVGLTIDASRLVPTAVENRPINYAANVCVVYE